MDLKYQNTIASLCRDINQQTNLILLCLLILVIPGYSRINNQMRYDEFFDLSLEQLLQIKVLSATKVSEEAITVPATVLVVSKEQIHERGYHSILDVLWDLPEFNIQDLTSPQNRNIISIRGLYDQTFFLILLDGVKISSPANDIITIMENYPVHIAKQIEIIYGPASALYGADAVSGVINIVTKNAEDDTLAIEGSVSAGMYETTNNTLWLSKKIGEETTITLGGQFFYDNMTDYESLYKDDSSFDTQGLNSGTFNTMWGPMTPAQKPESGFATPYRAYNIFGKLKSGPFSFSLFRNMATVSNALPYTADNAVYNKDVIHKTHITSVTSSYNREIGSVTSLSTLTGTMFETDPESYFQNVFVNMEKGHKYGFSKVIKAEEQLTWDASKGINIIGGVSYEHFVTLPKGADLDAPVDESKALEGTLTGTRMTNNPDGISADFFVSKYYNSASYLQARLSIMDNLNLTAGGRWDYNSQYGNTINPRAGIVYQPTTRTTIKGLYGTAYLAPTPYRTNEHYGSFYSNDSGRTYASYFWHLPNPNLEPVEETTYEMSITQLFGKNFGVTLTGYYIRLSNLLAIGGDAENGNIYNGEYKNWPVDYIEVAINEGEQQSYGGTLQLNHTLKLGKQKRIHSYCTFSYLTGTHKETYIDVNGITKTVDAEIADHLPITVKAGTDIRLNDFSISPRLIYVYEQKGTYFKDPAKPNKRQSFDGYTLLNLTTQYRLGSFTIFANLYNVLNQEYAIFRWIDKDSEAGTTVNPKTGFAQRKFRISGGVKYNL